MPSPDVDILNGDVRIRVTGIRDLTRSLEKAGVDASDIKETMQAAGEIVARRASWMAPSRSGALRNNLRVSKAKTKASIRFGSARVPYARFVYFGKYNESKGGLYQKANPFIYDALTATRSQVFSKIEQGITDILQKNDLI